MNAGTGEFPNMGAYAQMWSDFMSQMMKSGAAMTPDSTPPDMAREMRTVMLQAWSDYCDKFMRSGDFLNMMKQSLETSLAARRQFNELLANTQHQLQLASRQDVDQIMASLQRMERRMVDGIDELTSRMEQVEQRLQDLAPDHCEEQDGDGGGKKKQKQKHSRKKNE